MSNNKRKSAREKEESKMTTYLVNYEYRDNGAASVNLCDGPSMVTVKDWYNSRDKSVFDIREITNGEIREAVAKGMPWTEVPASFIARENDNRILDVLSAFVELAENEENDKLVDRLHEIMDAINEGRL